MLKNYQKNITSLVDDKGLTLLHHAVLKGIEGKTKLIIDVARITQKIDEDIILSWIDKKTYDEGWTALHYASF
jgi:hypothetical protein